MAKDNGVSLSVIKRLPKYYRYLESINDRGIVRVSSKELSEITGLTASQIRQDLNHYGCFGQQGYGYNVRELMDELSKIIGVDKEYKMVLVGFGNIGHALFQYKSFKDLGYHIDAVFDLEAKDATENDPEVNKIVDQINEIVANLKTGKYHAVALTSQLFDVVSLVENLMAFNVLNLNTFQSKVWNKLRDATYQRYTKDGNLLNFIPFP